MLFFLNKQKGDLDMERKILFTLWGVKDRKNVKSVEVYEINGRYYAHYVQMNKRKRIGAYEFEKMKRVVERTNN